MLNKSPLISIVTVNFNNLEGLRATHRSVVNLSYRQIEWIVIDGDSSDGSVDFLKEIDSVQYVSEPDRGVYDGMNKGLRLAAGEYVVFMNSGDEFYSPGALDIFLSSGVDSKLIVCDAVFSGVGVNFYRKFRNLNLFSFALQNPFSHQSLFYNLSCVKNIDFYDLRYAISSDFDFTLRYFLEFGSIKIDNIVSRCEVGGMSDRRRFRSLRDRAFSVVRSGNLILALAMIFTLPFIFFRLLVVRMMEFLGVIGWYRNIKYFFVNIFYRI